MRKIINLDFIGDLADGLKRYRSGNAAVRLDGQLEQLSAVIQYLELTVDGADELLIPLYDLKKDLMNLTGGHRPAGLEPPGRAGRPSVEVDETMKRGRAVALMELHMLDGKSEEDAANEAARVFEGISGGQVKNWRKKAKTGRDVGVRVCFEESLKIWTRAYPGAPGQAAEAMKKSIRKAAGAQKSSLDPPPTELKPGAASAADIPPEATCPTPPRKFSTNRLSQRSTNGCGSN